jgi:hypothetical protein
MNDSHRRLLAEIRRRLEEARDDPNVMNRDGSNYWGPYVTRAINDRDGDGSALVSYIKGVLRKSGDSEGWNALFEADRLDLSFEDMVLHAAEPIRDLFDDKDREIAARSLGDQRDELDCRRAAVEAGEVERDRRIVAEVAAKRRAEGKPWTPEIESRMLSERAERRRANDL